MVLPTIFLGILTAMLSFQTAFVLAAELYRWTDEKGTVHYTDDPSNIPQGPSVRVEKRRVPESPANDTPPPVKPDEALHDRNDRVQKYLEEMDRKIEERKKLETRILELEGELEIAERRLAEIERYERDDFQYFIPFRDKNGRFVPVGSPYYDEKVELGKKVKRIRDQLDPLQEKLEHIKKSL